MTTQIKVHTQSITGNWLWVGVNMVALLPLIRLVWMVGEAPRSRGPIMFATDLSQNIILYSGKTALVLLVLSLVCTPLARICNFNQVIKVRKSLGLWGFFYACFHAFFFMGGKEFFLLESTAWWNVWQMLPPILRGLTKTPYAREGAYALALLSLLALTSNRLSIRLLRKNWKRLHRLVYLAVPLAVYHYWRREEFSEVPDYWQPALFGAAVGLLLVVRVPPLRRRLADLLAAWQPEKWTRVGRRIRSLQATPQTHGRIIGRAPGQQFARPSRPWANEGNGHAGSTKHPPHEEQVKTTKEVVDVLERR
jgi:methionine sulfoxide reductase heme-binding subunit